MYMYSIVVVAFSFLFVHVIVDLLLLVHSTRRWLLRPHIDVNVVETSFELIGLAMNSLVLPLGSGSGLGNSELSCLRPKVKEGYRRHTNFVLKF